MVSVRVSPGTRGSGTAAWELRLGEGRGGEPQRRARRPRRARPSRSARARSEEGVS